MRYLVLILALACAKDFLLPLRPSTSQASTSRTVPAACTPVPANGRATSLWLGVKPSWGGTSSRAHFRVRAWPDYEWQSFLSRITPSACRSRRRRTTLFVDQSAPRTSVAPVKLGSLPVMATSLAVSPALTSCRLTSASTRMPSASRSRRAFAAYAPRQSRNRYRDLGSTDLRALHRTGFPTMGTPLRAKYTAPDQQRSWTRSDTGITGYYGNFETR